MKQFAKVNNSNEHTTEANWEWNKLKMKQIGNEAKIRKERKMWMQKRIEAKFVRTDWPLEWPHFSLDLVSSTYLMMPFSM